VLHLLSSGFWLGALAPLLFSLREMVLPDRGHHAALALRRFSGLGHFAVAAVLASGVSNSWFVLQGAALDAGSNDQRLLAAKVLIALTMVGLAVVNRYVFVPRIPNGGPGARQLAHGTIAEVVLSAALLAIVALLGMLSPHA
jgi:putative copper resistance protein D